MASTPSKGKGRKPEPPVAETVPGPPPWIVVMRNITTSSDLPKGIHPEIAEASASGLSLKIPAGSCAEGNLLLLRIFDEESFAKVRNSPRSVQDRAQRLSVMARVVGVAPAKPAGCVARLELQQFAEKDWKVFLATLNRPGLTRAAPAKKR